MPVFLKRFDAPLCVFNLGILLSWSLCVVAEPARYGEPPTPACKRDSRYGRNYSMKYITRLAPDLQTLSDGNLSRGSACARRVSGRESRTPSLHSKHMVSVDIHLQMGVLLFEGLDQIDLTGPFEVLSRIPNSSYCIFAKSVVPVGDVRGLRWLPMPRSPKHPSSISCMCPVASGSKP